MLAFSEDQLNTQAGPGDGIVAQTNYKQNPSVASLS